jgi:hypothetical protein
MAQVSFIFKSVVQDFPEFDFIRYLSSSSNIVHSKSFESGVIKIQESREQSLTTPEKIEFERLKKPSTASTNIVEKSTPEDYAKRLLKKKKN